MKKRISIKSCLIAGLLFFSACTSKKSSYTTWENYGGNKENNHYSSLTQIDTNNVTQLQPAWTFNTGDADTAKFSQIQCNPITVSYTHLRARETPEHLVCRLL